IQHQPPFSSIALDALLPLPLLWMPSQNPTPNKKCQTVEEASGSWKRGRRRGIHIPSHREEDNERKR
ncbi:hypothetical protein KI387_026345, partial [Taxus chinensis]